MKRAFQCVLLALLVASLSILTGCWNYKELESHYIVSGIAIDKGKQGHRYHLTFEVLDIAGDGQSGTLKGKLIRADGDTIADAVDNASRISDKELYYSDCKAVIFSRQIAREGLIPVMDWLNRDPKPRFTVQIFVSLEETAEELFEPGGQSGGQSGSQAGGQSGGQAGEGTVISMQIANSMEAASTGRQSIQMHLYDVDNVLLGEGRDLVLPGLRKSGQKTPQVEVDGTAVFREDKYVGELDDELTKNFLLLMNNLQTGTLLVGQKPEEKNIALLIRNSSVEVNPEVNGGKIGMKIKMKMECSFDEENSYRNYLLDLGANRIEGFAKNTLRKQIEELVRQVQTEFGCDIFGFGRKISQENPKEWQKLKPSWREKFRTVSVDVEPDILIVNAEFAHPKGYT